MKSSVFIRISLAALCFCATSIGIEDPSMRSPMLIQKETTIELTEDITIDSKGSPFVVGPAFGQIKAEKLIITSTKGAAVIVSATGVWDVSLFSGPTKTIEFRGNARLILHQGAGLHGLNTTLVFAENSRIE
ncbi:hypothetical protein H0W26_01305 [Candidatus Dependentiae bacterium]|nr:hypothetical protein [Candidatus Dependentiae bacterium]